MRAAFYERTGPAREVLQLAELGNVLFLQDLL